MAREPDKRFSADEYRAHLIQHNCCTSDELEGIIKRVFGGKK
jgi:hypothetical protein